MHILYYKMEQQKRGSEKNFNQIFIYIKKNGMVEKHNMSDNFSIHHIYLKSSFLNLVSM